jgi:hypothetical protein
MPSSSPHLTHGRETIEMTNAEAYRQIYGSSSRARSVLRQRQVIANDASSMLRQFRSQLAEEFPPVDLIGGRVDSTLAAALSSLEYQIGEIELAIKSCESTADTAKAPSGHRARPGKQSPQR